MAKIMTKSDVWWKVKNLNAMIKNEQNHPMYGATLDHWAGNCHPIHIDEQALRCLVRHYKRRKVVDG